jgi:hypothetical protein
MPYYTPGFNAAVDGIAAAGTWIAFHTADPAGTAGASQVGSRVQTTWAAASSGSRAGSQVTAAITAATAITHWSVNTASTGGSMIYSDNLRSAGSPITETFTLAGSLLHTPTISATN